MQFCKEECPTVEEIDVYFKSKQNSVPEDFNKIVLDEQRGISTATDENQSFTFDSVYGYGLRFFKDNLLVKLSSNIVERNYS